MAQYQNGLRNNKPVLLLLQNTHWRTNISLTSTIAKFWQQTDLELKKKKISSEE